MRKFCFCPSQNLDKSKNFKKNCRPCPKGKFLRRCKKCKKNKMRCWGKRKVAKFMMRLKKMTPEQFDKKKEDLKKRLSKLMNITESRIHVMLKGAAKAPAKAPAKASAKAPAKAPAPPAKAPAAAKTSRRLLGLLAVNGQAEDSAEAEL